MHLTHEVLRIPYRAGRFAISGSASDTATTVLVTLRATADEAGVGFGEAVPAERVTGYGLESILARLAECAGAVASLRIDPDAPPPPVPAAAGERGPVACALDGAILDFWARARGEPLQRALGLPRAERPTTATVSLADPARMAAEAEALLAAGFTHLKVKLGEDAETDQVRLAAVRAVAPRATLRVDGNEGWRLPAALEMVPALAAAGVDVIEQPLPRNAPARDHAQLNRAVEAQGIAHVVDEAVHTAADVERIAAAHLAHGVNVKLQKAGGLRPAVAALDAAERHGLRTMIGCFVETWAGIALAAQLAGRATWLDLDGAWLLAEEPVRPVAPMLRQGCIKAGDAPGLGLTRRTPEHAPGRVPGSTEGE